ncbi:MAG: DUF2784 domain-containing protein [Thermoguttaceae bacterium]
MNFYLLLADAILLLHFAYVLFVLLGMPAILIGVLLRWTWVRNFWFRAIHLAAIGLVVLESICGIACPLTVWEDRLREAGGGANEPGWFLGRWIERLLFVDASPTVLLVCYVAFGAAVLLTFYLAPPRRPQRRLKL